MTKTTTTGGHVDRVVGADNLPEPVLRLGSLGRVDYGDWFSLGTDVLATPEKWARAMLGDVPNATELLIWRGFLGFRVRREQSPDLVAGWPITLRSATSVRLEAASWFVAGNLVVRVAEGRASLGTFLRYDRALARAVWPPLSAVHRRMVPGLLRAAEASLLRGSPNLGGPRSSA
jgi:hypothetical protein